MAMRVEIGCLDIARESVYLLIYAGFYLLEMPI